MNAYDIALQISREPRFIKRNFIYPKSFHWRYFLYRVARPCLKLIYKIFKLTHPYRPWTSQASIRIFENILNREMIGLEYGSGNSTIFLARRLRHLTSVEHHEGWYRTVQNQLKALELSNVDYHLIPPQASEVEHPYTFYKDFGFTENDFQVRREYHSYFSFVTRYPSEHFDFILVDGRARVECALLAIPKLKPGGIFVLDNSDRTRYIPIFTALKSWKKVTTTTGLFDTTIWFKPERT